MDPYQGGHRLKEVIDSCDYYVVIVGGRYGSVTVEGVSFTEKEYDHAVEEGLPVLGFVHADPGVDPFRPLGDRQGGP